MLSCLRDADTGAPPNGSSRSVQRRWIWLIASTAALIAVPAAAIVAAATLLDPNDYKQQIADAVQRATGRTLTLAGPLRVAPSLWPTIEATDVQLANLPGGSRPDMAKVERITARLSLLGLLHRQLDVLSLTLIGPNILFEQVNGKPNWVFRAPGFEPDPTTESASGGISLRFRTVHVTNGMVTTKLPARTNVIGIRSADLRRPEENGPLDLASVLVYSDFKPFTMNVRAQPSGGVSDPWTTAIAVAAFDTTAQASGTMDLGGAYDLRVEGKSGALERLNDLQPFVPFPPLRDVTLATHVTNGPVRGALPVIGKTELRFASADLNDRYPGLKLGAVSLALPAPGGIAAIDGRGSLAGQPFSLDGGVGVPEHPDGPNTVPLDLTAKALAPAKDRKPGDPAYGSMALKGKLRLDTFAFAGLDTAVSLRSPALVRLRPIVSDSLPDLTGVALDGRVTIPADARTLTLADAKLASGQGAIDGTATLGLTAVSFKGKLHSSELDMDKLLDALGLQPSPAPAPARAADAPLVPDGRLPWALLRGPAVDIAATVDVMNWGGESWRDVQLALTLDRGKLRVSRFRVALPGGPADLAMTADAAATPVPVTVSLAAPAVPFALLARAAGLPGPASGSVRFRADLRGAGATVREVVGTLSGPVSATMAGGSMSNAALVALAAAPLQMLGISVPPGGSTAIDCFGLSGTLARGVADLTMIALDTSYLKMAGAGTVDLGREQLDLRLYPMAKLTGSLVRVPVVVRGPIGSATGVLDADLADKAELLLNALFGGDEATICADAGLARPGAR